jgi:zinc transport system ATP-binding protein
VNERIVAAHAHYDRGMTSAVSAPLGNPSRGAPALALEYRDVSFSYPRAHGANGSSRPALERITLDVPEGTRLGILGPNGGGKSTLLRLTLGLLRGHAGTIRVFGRSPDVARREGLIGYVPQRIDAELAFPLSVRQVVEMPALLADPPWRGASRGQRDRIDECLRVVGVLELADRPIGRLSGGQLQRVMIARALAARPRLLLLDEPTVGIDVVGQQKFGALMETLHAALGLTIVVVSHDLRTIAAGSDRVACLSRSLHSHIAPAGLTPAVLAEVFSHDVAAIFGDVHIDAHKASECHDPGHQHAQGCSHEHDLADTRESRGDRPGDDAR